MQKPTLFVDVILPLYVPKMYTYRVPMIQEGNCEKGKRVVVQFGKTKLYTGVIYSVHEIPPREYEAKYIEYVLDESPIITDLQFKLWEWMAEYYMCYPGEIFNVALPGNLKLNSETKFYTHPFLEEFTAEIDEKELKVLDALSINQGLTLNEISKNLEIKNAQLLLKKMVERKLITSEEEVKQLYKPKTEVVLNLNSVYTDEKKLNALLNQLEKRAAKQVDVMMCFLKQSLKETGKHCAVRREIIKKEIEDSDAAITALVKKQILISEKIETDRIKENIQSITGLKKLSLNQQSKFEEIKTNFTKHEICLLHGVTASGKTEIYFHLIEEQLKKNKKVLFLMPEIAITTQMVKRLQKAFGNVVGVYHSRFNPNERVEVWMKTLSEREDSYKIIIGARSAVFLPFNNLGLVIVDEEHENSYKQQNPAPRYNGRDTAIVLASLAGAKTLLGSATPAVETYSNARQKKYGYVVLRDRFAESKFPEVRLIDIKLARKEKKLKEDFSHDLLDAVAKTLERKKQIILFQNRRGYTPLWMCNDCAWIAQCNHCSVNLTYHKHTHQLICHYCNTRYTPESRCKACGSNNVKMLGLGTEKIEESLQLFFPDAKIARMDLDTTRSKHGYRNIIENFEEGKTDILIGTQMVTKGLDFGNVELVVIPGADSILHYPEFRAHEKAYQLFTQVSGRAGRTDNAGKVLIQTNDIQNKVLELIKQHDFDLFYEIELRERKKFFYPPYSRIIHLQLSHTNKETCETAANELAKTLKKEIKQRLLGPERPLINKINNQYLMNMTIKLEKSQEFGEMKKFIAHSLSDFKMFSDFKAVRVIVDVDPV